MEMCLTCHYFMHVYDPYMGYEEDLATLSVHLLQHKEASPLSHHLYDTQGLFSFLSRFCLAKDQLSSIFYNIVYNPSVALCG